MANGILAPGAGLYPGATSAAKSRQIRYGDAPEDYAIYNAQTKRYESAKTGQAWTGAIRGTNAFANNGAWTDKDPGGASQPALPEFTTIKTEKQPGIATATGGLLDTFKKNATSTGTAFGDFLSEARDVNAKAKVQLGKDQAAFDTSKLETQLPKINEDYRATQTNLTGRMADSNQAYAKETADTIARLNDENSKYEAAARAAADKAIGNATARVNLYQLTSGTPTSGSGNLTNRYMRAVSDIEVPLQRELSARRYGQIADVERQYQRELYGQDQALLARESGLAADFAGRDENTARYLNDLRMKVAGMARNQAQDYLRGLGLPFDMAQRIIAGDIANLGGIQALDERANYYTVATPYNESRLPQVSSPAYVSPSRGYVGGGVEVPNTSYVPPAVREGVNPAVAGAPTTADERTNYGYVPSELTRRIQANWASGKAAPQLAYQPAFYSDWSKNRIQIPEFTDYQNYY